MTDKIHWLSDSDYAKARTQFSMQVGGVLQTFAMYGMDIYIPGAQAEIVKLAEDFGLRVRGVDHPISLERIRGK